MDAQKRFILHFILLVVGVAAFGGLIRGNIAYARQNPGGIDFLPRWLGTRLYVIEGQSPYSETTTLAIQQDIYGRPAQADEDQALFVYPFYSFVVFLPLAVFAEFSVARGVLMAFMEVAVLVIAALSITLARGKITPWTFGLILLFSIGWFHTVDPLINSNPAILVALFITLAIWAIREEHDVLAGSLLALATIKPQMVILLIPFVMLWAIANKRFLIISVFFGVLALMIAASLLLLPGWPLEFIRQLITYPAYSGLGSPGAVFKAWLPGIGLQMGWVLTSIMAIILIIEWAQAINKDFRWFYWAACLTLVITNLIGIQTAITNYIALLPVVILVFVVWVDRWHMLGRFMTGVYVIVLGPGLWWLYIATLIPGQQGGKHPGLLFPVPILLIISLFWVRHWAVRSTRPLLDELRGGSVN